MFWWRKTNRFVHNNRCNLDFSKKYCQQKPLFFLNLSHDCYNISKTDGFLNLSHDCYNISRTDGFSNLSHDLFSREQTDFHFFLKGNCFIWLNRDVWNIWQKRKRVIYSCNDNQIVIMIKYFLLPTDFKLR